VTWSRGKERPEAAFDPSGAGGFSMSDINSMVAYDDGDIDTNRSANTHMSELIATRLSRRQTLRHGVSAMTTALFGGALLAGCDDENPQAVTATAAGSTASVAAGRWPMSTGARRPDRRSR
jgi:uncharacterized protein